MKSHCTSQTKNKQEKSTKNIQGWERVLYDAKDALKEHRSHGRALRRAVNYIEKKIADGASFPVGTPETVEIYQSTQNYRTTDRACDCGVDELFEHCKAAMAEGAK